MFVVKHLSMISMALVYVVNSKLVYKCVESVFTFRGHSTKVMVSLAVRWLDDIIQWIIELSCYHQNCLSFLSNFSLSVPFLSWRLQLIDSSNFLYSYSCITYLGILLNFFNPWMLVYKWHWVLELGFPT
jgi:phosphoribulokinase